MMRLFFDKLHESSGNKELRTHTANAAGETQNKTNIRPRPTHEIPLDRIAGPPRLLNAGHLALVMPA